MGIAKLAQDLRPYAESVILGRHPADSWPRVTSIVIDGPSLVYSIFFRLLSWKDRSLNPIDAQPSYDEISTGVARFLLELKDQDVQVQKIFFDGALPVSKRLIRTERLEKARFQLQTFCDSNFRSFNVPDIRSREKIDPSRCFNGFRPLPRNFSDLPPPPFMIPTVIEDLQSRWTQAALENLRSDTRWISGQRQDHAEETSLPFADLVEVVLGEGDPYCAAQASSTGAAILSSDFDMLVYDLGRGGSLLLLDSLELEDWHTSRVGRAKIKALCLCPSRIEERLHIPGLRRLAFQRKQDSHASTAVILHRTRQPPQTEAIAWQYEKFAKEFDCHHIRIARTEMSPPTLPLLDPRIAELYSQFKYPDFVAYSSEDPYVYLPIMIEQHSRDSSWSYGLHFRQLAYSLLNLSVSRSWRHENVSEFQRRGSRMVTLSVPLLSLPDTLSRLVEVTEVIMTTKAALYRHDREVFLYWRLCGICIVSRIKQQSQKPLMTRRWILEFLKNGYIDQELTWYDIHVYANVQAVLYSIRMVKQILSVVLSSLSNELAGLAQDLTNQLADMPRIGDLIASRSSIRNTAPALDLPLDSIVSEMMNRIHGDDSWEYSTPDSDDAGSMEVDESPRSPLHIEDESMKDEGMTDFIPNPRKRQRSPEPGSGSDASSRPRASLGRRRRLGNNPFELLEMS